MIGFEISSRTRRICGPNRITTGSAVLTNNLLGGSQFSTGRSQLAVSSSKLVESVESQPNRSGATDRVASALLSCAAEFMRDKLSLEFGFLLCRREVSPVYAKLGWTLVEGPTIFSQPGGSATYPHETMILRLADREWPCGEIDMMGLPW